MALAYNYKIKYYFLLYNFMKIQTCQVEKCNHVATNTMVMKYIHCTPKFKIETPLCPDHYEEMDFNTSAFISFERIPLEELITQ